LLPDAGRDPTQGQIRGDQVRAYLRAVFAFLGVTQTTFINAGGTAELRSAEADRGAFLEPYVKAVALHVG
jgi:FMN-dependent NADH-azoreductase